MSKRCSKGYKWSDYQGKCVANLTQIQRNERGGNKKCKLSKETKDGFYCSNYPKDLHYVVRWLADGGYHLYPKADGFLPKGYKTKEIAGAMAHSVGGKVVTGTQARKYPIPKRW